MASISISIYIHDTVNYEIVILKLNLEDIVYKYVNKPKFYWINFCPLLNFLV
mgnify:CR=1 FL=1